ncbi:putative RNA-directed DNA polymerase [Helianthus annuus]|nr:putative RNA-directed DNA polymerase [Helianthus annuus]KAJ0563074.1 putative RNA-directed DNA polymerase [Helianthus annuus]KAJ0731198.1 putative RNA-directed DNA polymerase [Helianthus annuus]
MVDSGFKDIVMGTKLKAIKEELKKWRLKVKELEEINYKDAEKKMNMLDEEAEKRTLTENELEMWKECKKLVKDWKLKKVKDLKQKSRVKWLCHGDENSSFFHACVNNNIAKGKISGLWINDVWVSDPTVIKDHFKAAFEEKFQEPLLARPRMLPDGFLKLSIEQAGELVTPFSKEEIKKAVWECGSDKAPGPDGITFALIKKYWVDFEPIVEDVMQQFFTHGSIQQCVSSSFISLIPKVADPVTVADFRPISLIGVVNKIISKTLANRVKGVITSVVSNVQSAFLSNRNIVDGPLILNELVSWAKRSKKTFFIFKADIEKAYDTISWKFLISVLTFMGFPAKWRNWVMGIFFSGRASVLVNGSPTGEFQYRRGLRQGDPLSPFLFVLAMEALHVMMTKAVNDGLFSGVQLPNNGPYFSHMFFADDAIFMGQWDEGNLKNLRRILRCFYLVSGLKVNQRKSYLYGVGKEEEEIQSLAYHIRCNPAPLAVVKTIEGIRRKFLWGGCGVNNKIRWVRWEKIVASKKFGGLGVGGIKELNLALLLKWWWRLKSDPDQLWVKVVESIHHNTRIVNQIPVKKSSVGVWKNIVGVEKDFRKYGIMVGNKLVSNVGNGKKTMFWVDSWINGEPLKDRFPLLYQLVKNKKAKVWDCYRGCMGGLIWDWEWNRTPINEDEKSEMEALNTLLSQQAISDGDDKWRWKDEMDKGYTVRRIRQELSKFLDMNSTANGHEWNRIAPPKVNMFVWRALEGKIPTSLALMNRGVPVQNVFCAFCGNMEESADHLLVRCIVADSVWQQIFTWVKAPVGFRPQNMEELMQSINGLSSSTSIRKLIHSIYLVTLWKLWSLRNKIVFESSNISTYKLVEEIKETTFDLVTHRAKRTDISWMDWRIFRIGE